MRLAILCQFGLIASVHALGFANGVKIGEVTPDSAVLWTRLTAADEAENRVASWNAEDPHWRAPGLSGHLTFRYWPENRPEAAKETPPVKVGADTDFCHQVRVAGLLPATNYAFSAIGRSGDDSAGFTASFTTAPADDSGAPVTFVVSTCQDFPRRDDTQNGHRIYRSMLELGPAFFIQTGDTLYYDKPKPFAKDLATARYKWNRLYALPNLREFHRRIPTYWMHDDHDLLKNDCWPGQRYGDLTWDQGLKIWHEQVPQSDLPYRRFRWGRHLEIWLPEGREHRSPNPMKDGPEKSIFGDAQWKWLEDSMRRSDATFKLFVSATPVVGPDRKNKNDNHANEGFAHEGERLRRFLSAIPGCFVINGDRHWQYHSVDAETGLHEFGCGPASDLHAGGWKPGDRRPEHRFLRVKGGFASISVEAGRAVVTHHDVDGKPVHRTEIER